MHISKFWSKKTVRWRESRFSTNQFLEENVSKFRFLFGNISEWDLLEVFSTTVFFILHNKTQFVCLARFTATQFDAFPSSSDLEVKQKKSRKSWETTTQTPHLAHSQTYPVCLCLSNLSLFLLFVLRWYQVYFPAFRTKFLSSWAVIPKKETNFAMHRVSLNLWDLLNL